MELINRYFNNPSQPLTTKRFQEVLLQIQFENKDGLNRQELYELANKVLKHKLGSKQIQLLMGTLIPKLQVSQTTIQVILRWLLANYKTTGKEALKSILNWVIGIMEYKLTDIKYIETYYHLFFWILDYDSPQAAQIVYLLTKPRDVNRWLVEQVMDLQKKFDNKSYKALLYLYKTYNPNCLPENIPAIAAKSVFGKLPEVFEEKFMEARERCLAKEPEKKTEQKIQWTNIEYKKVKESAVTLVPRTLIVNKDLASDYTPLNLLSVTNKKELHKMICKSSAVIEGTCLMSLLNDTPGLHILAVSNMKIQTRLSYLIYHTLYNALLEHDCNTPYKEKEYLLKCLAHFQCYIQQGVPVISLWLSKYMPVWDGDDYFPYIFKLLEYVHFTKYEELHKYILEYLHELFITGDVDMKCKIIRLLGNIIVNIIISKRCQDSKKNKKNHSFLQKECDYDFEDVLGKLYDFIEELCLLGIYLEAENITQLCHCIIHLHTKILRAESILEDFQFWITLPTLSYFSLFYYNPSLICRMCELFTRFPDSISKTVLSDYLFCLEKFSQTPVEHSYFENFSSLQDKTFSRFGLNINDVRYLLDINNHLAFTCFDYYFTIPNKREWHNRLRKKAVKIKQVIKLCYLYQPYTSSSSASSNSDINSSVVTSDTDAVSKKRKRQD